MMSAAERPGGHHWPSSMTSWDSVRWVLSDSRFSWLGCTGWSLAFLEEAGEEHHHDRDRDTCERVEDAPSLGSQIAGMWQVQGDEDRSGDCGRIEGVIHGIDGHPHTHESDDDLFKRAGTGDGHQEDGGDRGAERGASKALYAPKGGLLQRGFHGDEGGNRHPVSVS